MVLAEDKNLTGRFFGEVEGAVMDFLRTDNAVFKKVSIFDYQGLCLDDRTTNSDASFILSVSSVFKLNNLNIWIYNIS